ncbi:hypothetical protein PG996_008127 [Apiospora saccharicola]|uniref:Solute carrier family 40 protein n=1 Tax=Apiospora saccharicola TaxID=335842 RepID=A0ABR1UX52_9PEZI
MPFHHRPEELIDHRHPSDSAVAYAPELPPSSQVAHIFNTQSKWLPKSLSVVVAAALPKGIFGQTFDAVTSPENAAVVRSVAVFGAAVAFLSTSWAELLLTPA